MIQSPLVASSEVVRENILRQKANVGHQLRLVNEQIFLYRVSAVCICMETSPYLYGKTSLYVVYFVGINAHMYPPRTFILTNLISHECMLLLFYGQKSF